MQDLGIKARTWTLDPVHGLLLVESSMHAHHMPDPKVFISLAASILVCVEAGICGWTALPPLS